MQADRRPGKYLTFKLGHEEFGISVIKVREIMTVPRTPDDLKDGIYLRGKAVPVVDLRLKFGLPAMEHTKRTCIVVVEVEGDAGPVLVGVVVDSVCKVLTFASSDIKDARDFGAKPTRPFLLGMAKVEGKVKFLLDINRVAAGALR